MLTISQPESYANLAHQLGDRWPSLAAYVVSFAVIGIMWFNHHSIFAHIGRIDRLFFYLNLFLLMTVAFLPYPTGVLGQALRKGQGAKTAAVFYSATMTLNAIAWDALWLYASTGRRLLVAEFPESQRRVATALFVSGTAPYALSIVIALASAYACLFFHGALALYYAFDPLSRRVGTGAI